MSQPIKLSDLLVPARTRVDRIRLLSALLKSVDSKAGRKRVTDYLATQAFPHYEPARGQARLLVRIEANGRRTVGRFENREFVPVRSRRARR